MTWGLVHKIRSYCLGEVCELTNKSTERIVCHHVFRNHKNGNEQILPNNGNGFGLTSDTNILNCQMRSESEEKDMHTAIISTGNTPETMKKQMENNTAVAARLAYDHFFGLDIPFEPRIEDYIERWLAFYDQYGPWPDPAKIKSFYCYGFTPKRKNKDSNGKKLKKAGNF